MNFDKKYYVDIWGTVHRHEYCDGLADQLIQKYGRVRILDIGTGCGFLVKTLREKGCDAWGIDISDYALKNSCDPEHVKRGDIRSIPFPTGRFDVIHSQGVWGYFPEKDIQKAWAECKRVGKIQHHNIDPDPQPPEHRYLFTKSHEWWDKKLAPKVLITGSTGFFGKHLKVKLEQLGWEIHESNTRTQNLMYPISYLVKFDYIFHLAGLTGAGDWPINHKADSFEANQIINSNILKYWKDFQPQAKFIGIGTSCSYSPDLPMSEDNYLLGQPEKDLYSYAMIKRMLLIGLQSYAGQYGLKYMYYVPSTLYGAGFDSGDNHFIFDLIRKISSTNPILWGDGYQKRELIYIDDAIDIILQTLHLENELLNLGSGEDHTIREFADMVSEIVGYKGEVSWDTTKYVGVPVKKLDTAKLLKLLPNFKFTPLYPGLQKTIHD